MSHKSWCEFGKNWKNILEKRFIRVLGITLVLHFAKVITDRIWLMNWDWTKVGKGLVLIRWKLIQNDWLVVVFVCLFMSASGASLTHFTFIFFLKVIVLSTRFYCRIVSGKSAWKPSGERPPNSSKLAWKATILLIWKVIQTHHNQPNHSNRIPTVCSRIFIGAYKIITWNLCTGIEIENIVKFLLPVWI